MGIIYIYPLLYKRSLSMKRVMEKLERLLSLGGIKKDIILLVI